MAKTKALKAAKLPKPLEAKYVSLSTLKLDNENPRFAGTLKGKSEEEIIARLAEEKNLYELIESFRQNGYYEAEPLLVIEDPKKSGTYIVIEGNRRVAALKVIFSKSLLKQYKFGENYFDSAIEDDLKNKIPIQIYKNRTDLWSYLGFRHIKGPMPWDSYSKGLYIVSLFDEGTTIDDIVEKIGDQNSLVFKMFNGIRVIHQAEKEKFIDPVSMQKFSFSHLYTILGYSNTQKFLGLKIKADTLLKENPVPGDKVINLKWLVDLIYGDKEGKNKPVIRSQNPDIRRLDAVLGSISAIAELKNSINQPGSLENAFLSTSAAEEIVPDLIAEALAKLKKASGNLYMYKKTESSVQSMMEEIVELAKYIIENLKRDGEKKKSGKKKNTKK
jgi:hypothetical protein